METKKKIRQEMLAVRDAIFPEEKERLTKEILKRIEELPEFRQAENILAFAGYGSEPDTLPVLEQWIKNGKKVFCPVVLGETMEFYQICALSELKDGYKGIKEPVPSEERKYIPGDKDFMLLPGLVFDREGNRIGYGKGFYDRYLSEGFSGKMAAIAFSVQIVENGRIPAETTDHTIKCIVTEKEIIRI